MGCDVDYITLLVHWDIYISDVDFLEEYANNVKLCLPVLVVTVLIAVVSCDIIVLYLQMSFLAYMAYIWDLLAYIYGSCMVNKSCKLFDLYLKLFGVYM